MKKHHHVNLTNGSVQYFTLHQKKAGGPYQACFCYHGKVKWLGTGEVHETQAFRKAKEAEPEILKELALKAGLVSKKGVSTASPKTATPTLSTVPPLDLTTPAPTGSFREYIEIVVEFTIRSPGHIAWKRWARDCQKYLYEALGGYVDLQITDMDASMGAQLARYYNDPARFRSTSIHLSRHMRRFLRPMRAYGLPNEFIAALDNVQDRLRQDHLGVPLKAERYWIWRRMKYGVDRNQAVEWREFKLAAEFVIADLESLLSA